MVSYTGMAMAPRYAFALSGNYITCEVEVVEATYISQSSTRYYLLDEMLENKYMILLESKCKIRKLRIAGANLYFDEYLRYFSLSKEEVKNK